MLGFNFAIFLFIILNLNVCESISDKTSVKITNNNYVLPSKIIRQKRSENFQVPIINLDNTFLDEADIKEIQNEKPPPIPPNNKYIKYPYYKKFAKHHHLKHSPLRYAESVRNIPLKSEGGSEFYDSKGRTHCSEVQSDVDPVPDRIKNKMPPSDDEEEDEGDDDDDGGGELGNEDANEEESSDEEKRNKRELVKIPLRSRVKRGFEQHKEQPRLQGLGDKIDCFKDKYFGRDPLDSPFFDEDVIESPEFFGEFPMKPVKLPVKLPTTYEHLEIPKRSYVKKSPIKQFKQTNTHQNYNKPQIQNTEKYKNADFKDEDEGEIIYGKNKDIVSLPDLLFDKYLQSNQDQDPRVRVYGDVIGNIMSNLGDNKHSIPSPHSPHKITHVLGRNGDKYEIVPNPLQVNINQNSPPYRRPPAQYVRLARENDHYVQFKPNVNVYKNYRKIIRHKRSSKTYRTIGRKERQAQHFSESNNNNNSYNEESTEPIEANINLTEDNANENDTVISNNYTNHRKFYTPITTSNVISPDQLKIEYILRAAAELQRNDEILNKTLMLVHKNMVRPFVNVDNITNVTKDHDNKQNYTNIRRTTANPIRLSQNPNIFDVTAYLPKPIYLNSFSLRNNFSSKYLDTTINPYPDSSEEIDSATETYIKTENNNHNETLRHSVEVHPSATLTPSLLSAPVETEVITTTLQPTVSAIPRGRRRGQIYSTTTTESYIIFPPYSEDYSTVPSVYKSEENEQRIDTTQYTPQEETTTPSNADSKNPVDYWTQYLQSTKNTSPYVTESTYTTYVPSKAPSIRVKNRGRKPKRIKLSTTKAPQSSDESYESSYDSTTRKPTIVKKTSTKRKTTVITNSRRYRDDDEINEDLLNKEKNYDALEETSTIPYRPRPRVPVKKARQETTTNESTTRKHIPRQKNSHMNLPRDIRIEKKKAPIKETRKYVEDYQEEEIVQERKSPSFLEAANYGPTLAKEVNSLSESSDETFYPDNEYNVPNDRSSSAALEETNSNENVLKPGEHLEESILNESETDIPQQESKQAPNVVDDEGISARVLRSFASLFDMLTTTPKYEKDPSERLYFYLKP